MAACALLSVLLLMLGVAGAEVPIRVNYQSHRHRRNLLQSFPPVPLAPVGTWQSVRIVNPLTNATITNCGQRDYPPIGGDTPTRMLCGGVDADYSPYWVWKASLPSGDLVVRYGVPFTLQLFNGMLTFCYTISNGQIKCGTTGPQSTFFTVEKVGTNASGQPVDFNNDKLYLKSGSKYCRVSDSGNSAYVYCNGASSASASVFQLPYSHYYSVSLNSTLSGLSCGANFIINDYLQPNNVLCNTGAPIPSNFYTKFVAAAQVPGTVTAQGSLLSGAAYALTGYDQLWHYYYGAWSAATQQVISINDNYDLGTKVYFILEKIYPSGLTYPAGTLLGNGDRVRIKSVLQNKYCGLASAVASVTCDKTSVNSTDVGYSFIYSFV